MVPQPTSSSACLAWRASDTRRGAGAFVGRVSYMYYCTILEWFLHTFLHSIVRVDASSIQGVALRGGC
jgi:hypothetical protein